MYAELKISLASNWITRISVVSAIIGIVSGMITIAGFIADIPAEYWVTSLVIFLLIVSFSLGYYLAIRDLTKESTKVEGCIKKSGRLWRGSLRTKNDEWDSIEVEQYPTCQECQTGLRPDWSETSYESGVRGQNRRALTSATGMHERRRIWKCPDCSNEYPRDERERENIERVFEKHFSKIFNSQQEPYSYDVLRKDHRDDCDEQPDAAQIWKRYAEIVNDTSVSTECFF